MPNPTDVCSTCHGAFSEHQSRLHPFTKDGEAPELSTPTQREEAARRQQQGQQLRVQLPQINGTDSASIGRLLEVMLDKGLLDSPEALYILGVGPKPDRITIQYRDPFPSSRGGIY